MLSLFNRAVSQLRFKRLKWIRSFRTSAQTGEPTGLYGFHHLKTPKGFQRFVDDAIERSRELVTFISTMPSAAEIIRAMDEISNTVCSVIDSAELCRNTHPNREFVEEANKARMRVNEYLHDLNTNHILYDAVKKAEREGHTLPEEAQKAARNLRLDFERGGIHLYTEKLDRVNQLNIEISQLCVEFNENIAEDPGFVDIYPSSRISKHLHYLVKPIYRSRETIKEKGFRISTDPQTLASIMQLSSDEEVRKMVYKKGHSVPIANVGVLQRLITARHGLAQIMGCRSYAEFIVKSNMASSPTVVMPFLSDMSKMVRVKADEEFKAIRKFKREEYGKSFEDLKPWDEAYYTSKMKSSAFNNDHMQVIASYFPLSQCIEGLKVLVQSLFGATFHSIPPAPGESWDPQVLKLALRHPEEGDLGYLYLDLYSRKGKYPGFAHFAIKGGCRISETEYQLPVVALVCNFPGSSNPSTVRLNHWEVETLFHEFGHALHSLLSRTDYQHFSGTRVVQDFAEVPSNLFEYYAWDYRVLKTFAKHYSTGEEIPEKLVESMKSAKKMFAATDLQRQIFYALVDLTLFGEQPFPLRDTSSIIAELMREYTSWEHVEGTHWEARFSHLLNYGAGYYSYLYAKCFASTIWKKLELCKFATQLCKSIATMLYNITKGGGSKDGTEVSAALLQVCCVKWNHFLKLQLNCMKSVLFLFYNSEIYSHSCTFFYQKLL
ncbi:mitochondrial intermediate peptidase, mitochondrial isoform X1 [Senna tora]|uniref:Mitochondrial intermediate peptidase, mitochondrial isoform X1 n=1 Tax=Senna tora TaxID=362788 RepID=A0A834WMN7_9FABA|nr:mitochondrial intermediate peptidase, mitochondrial isoform X1 [Senna tora]